LSANPEPAINAAVEGNRTLVEFRAYRTAASEHQVVVTYEFGDVAAWAGWYDNADVRKLGGVDEELPIEITHTRFRKRRFKIGHRARTYTLKSER
jgi:hypothetical protein